MPKVKKETVKKEVTVKKVATKVVVKTPTEKKVQTKTVGLSIPLYSLAGKATGTLALPKEFFAATVNKQLLAQALRVYTTNKKIMLAKTKNRGEVKASKAKIYRQKGTGRARHGAISAPIFVGGGTAFGPQVRKVRLVLPQRMKKAALIAALSSKMADKEIVGVAGFDKATGKTKEVFNLVTKISADKKIKSLLIVTDQKADNVIRGVKNIPGIDALSTNLLNAYEILSHEMLVLTKEAVEALVKPKEDKNPVDSAKK